MVALQKAVDDSKDLKMKSYYPDLGVSIYFISYVTTKNIFLTIIREKWKFFTAFRARCSAEVKKKEKCIGDVTSMR